MPKSTIALRIPEPCAQPWAAMTSQGAGRHCAACQKVVIDFTQKTDAEILAMLQAAAAGRTCGRFAASQLGRPLQPLLVAPRAAWWQTAVAATAAVLGLQAVLPPAAQAQHPISQRPSTNQPELALQAVTKTAIPAPTGGKPLLLTGRVVDNESGEALPYVTVLLEGTTHGVSTNAEGAFSLTVFPEDQHRPLLISSIGYVPQTLAQPASQQPMAIRMSADVKGMLSGEVVVTTGYHYSPIYTPQGVWQRLRSIPWRMRNAFQRH
ncbi:carboxypeptidase-like regulatory domain-containing protein [Hymenobacter cellulosivorans]|uniref:Carboxypeptidase-like regulatory domain-containing protein n=1 Tax=Hymenobacter cellulosivorans TaxID=2932249 RepID=A0ABY4FBZ8_9BACT|nr:carboxypeptidase-like regulatory domain-containing protein [Hymenobacter cellulosivorans]UOQ54064.1 carboxypeptidase-like regulatory domain-containing protein [Hymenobacter cellulosivorans]